MSHWFSSYSLLTLFFFLRLNPIYPWFPSLTHSLALSHTHAHLLLLIFFYSLTEGKLACVIKHVRRAWSDDERQRYPDSLPLLEVQPSLDTYTPFPLLFQSSPLVSPPPLLCDDMHVLMETRCCDGRDEREKPSMRLHDTSLTDCRRCGEGGGGGGHEEGSCCFSLVVLRVQTVTVYTFRCQMKCAHYPEQGPERSRGVSLRIRLGQGEGSWGSESLNQHLCMMEVFFLQGSGKPRHMRRVWKKKQPKEVEMLIVQLPCTCIFSPTQYLPPTFKGDRSHCTPPYSKCRHCVKCNKSGHVALNW